MQSVLDRNDLDELMAMVRRGGVFLGGRGCVAGMCCWPGGILPCSMSRRRRGAAAPASNPLPAGHLRQADLADRDFTAERYQPVVLSMGGAFEAPAAVTEEERAAAEARFGGALQVRGRGRARGRSPGRGQGSAAASGGVDAGH
jgi:hypothetical protein